MLRLMSGDATVLNESVTAMFDSAKLAAEIALGLIGVLTLWMGLMRLGEKAGVIAAIAWVFEPLLSKLMPEVPRGHPAYGSVTMNLTANMLGLDNAATPLGLKAMADLQSLNPDKKTATNAQILFLVLNTSSVTLVPVTVFLYRAQQGAADPADIFLPILLSTLGSTLAGLSVVALVQRIRLLDWVALLRRVAVYDEFIEGAKSGFEQSVRLIPYLLAMLLAIALLRASGALDYLLGVIAALVSHMGMDGRFIDALPTALMKPLSGSGARAMMLETMAHYGVDSFAGRLAAIFQGSTETTFYVLAVYFGAVGIRNGRHALACGLFADLAGICTAIAVCYWFYG